MYQYKLIPKEYSGINCKVYIALILSQHKIISVLIFSNLVFTFSVKLSFYQFNSIEYLILQASH